MYEREPKTLNTFAIYTRTGTPMDKELKPFTGTLLVNKLVEAKQELSQLDERSVHAVNEIVEERTKHIQFFTNATINNLRMMESKINEGTSIVEHKIAQEAIAKGRETVLGKQPETQVNIQNNAPSQQSMMNLQEYAQINAELNDLV